MAIMKGNDLTGLLGPLVIKRGKNGKKIVQTKAGEYKQKPASIKSATMFGFGSTIASILRHDLNGTFGSNYDPDMINRFNEPVKKVLIHCFDTEKKTFHFEPDSFARLADFEFNMKSLLLNSLWVKPLMTLKEQTLTITIPEFTIPSQLKFPKDTNCCDIHISVTQLNMNQCLKSYALEYSFKVNADQSIVPITTIDFAVKNESLCVVAIGLHYSKVEMNTSTNYNTKAFNPANIIGALITPGVYVEPIKPVNIHKSEGKEWEEDSRLKF
jgi:hypothetical protein